MLSTSLNSVSVSVLSVLTLFHGCGVKSTTFWTISCINPKSGSEITNAINLNHCSQTSANNNKENSVCETFDAYPYFPRLQECYSYCHYLNKVFTSTLLSLSILLFKMSPTVIKNHSSVFSAMMIKQTQIIASSNCTINSCNDAAAQK